MALSILDSVDVGELTGATDAGLEEAPHPATGLLDAVLPVAAGLLAVVAGLLVVITGVLTVEL